MMTIFRQNCCLVAILLFCYASSSSSSSVSLHSNDPIIKTNSNNLNINNKGISSVSLDKSETARAATLKQTITTNQVTATNTENAEIVHTDNRDKTLPLSKQNNNENDIEELVMTEENEEKEHHQKGEHDRMIRDKIRQEKISQRLDHKSRLLHHNHETDLDHCSDHELDCIDIVDMDSSTWDYDIDRHEREWYRDECDFDSSTFDYDSLECGDLWDLTSRQFRDLDSSDQSYFRANCDLRRIYFKNCDDTEFEYLSDIEKEYYIGLCGDKEEREKQFGEHWFDKKIGTAGADCSNCIELADDFLGECVDNSTNCFDDSIGDVNQDELNYCLLEFPKTTDFARCCGMEGQDCNIAARDLQRCYDDCIPDCIQETADDYLQCMVYGGSRQGCDRETCMGGVFPDIYGLGNDPTKTTRSNSDSSKRENMFRIQDEEEKVKETVLMSHERMRESDSGDFDSSDPYGNGCDHQHNCDNEFRKDTREYDNLVRSFGGAQKLSYMTRSEMNDAICVDAEEYATDICAIGDDCCPRCNDFLGAAVECLVNQGLRPIIVDRLKLSSRNHFGDSDLDDCKLRCRPLLKKKQKREERQREKESERGLLMRQENEQEHQERSKLSEGGDGDTLVPPRRSLAQQHQQPHRQERDRNKIDEDNKDDSKNSHWLRNKSDSKKNDHQSNNNDNDAKIISTTVTASGGLNNNAAGDNNKNKGKNKGGGFFPDDDADGREEFFAFLERSMNKKNQTTGDDDYETTTSTNYPTSAPTAQRQRANTKAPSASTSANSGINAVTTSSAYCRSKLTSALMITNNDHVHGANEFLECLMNTGKQNLIPMFKDQQEERNSNDDRSSNDSTKNEEQQYQKNNLMKDKNNENEAKHKNHEEKATNTQQKQHATNRMKDENNLKATKAKATPVVAGTSKVFTWFVLFLFILVVIVVSIFMVTL